MNEAPEFEVLQPPLSQETLLGKALRGGADHYNPHFQETLLGKALWGGGADHLKVSELAMELTHSQTS